MDGYTKAINVADLITKEMSWLYANYQTFQSSGEEDVLERITNTYSGHVWKLIQRATLNEVFMALFRLIDRTPKTASIFSLKELLQEDVWQVIEAKYSQGEGTFDFRKKKFNDATKKLEEYMKDHESIVKKLIRHRHNYLAHRALKPYEGKGLLQIGDEKELIEIISAVIEPMEHLLLNGGNISYSTNSSYSLYSKNFWNSLIPENEKDKF